MNAARTQVAHFQRVVLGENVLHAQCPIQRIRQCLIGQKGRRLRSRRRSRECGEVESLRLGDSAVLKEVVADPQRGINSRAELGWNGVQSDVVEYDVRGPAEAGANYSVAAMARRPGDADAWSEAVWIGA